MARDEARESLTNPYARPLPTFDDVGFDAETMLRGAELDFLRSLYGQGGEWTGGAFLPGPDPWAPGSAAAGDPDSFLPDYSNLDLALGASGLPANITDPNFNWEDFYTQYYSGTTMPTTPAEPTGGGLPSFDPTSIFSGGEETIEQRVRDSIEDYAGSLRNQVLNGTLTLEDALGSLEGAWGSLGVDVDLSPDDPDSNLWTYGTSTDSGGLIRFNADDLINPEGGGGTAGGGTGNAGNVGSTGSSSPSGSSSSSSGVIDDGSEDIAGDRVYGWVYNADDDTFVYRPNYDEYVYLPPGYEDRPQYEPIPAADVVGATDYVWKSGDTAAIMLPRSNGGVDKPTLEHAGSAVEPAKKTEDILFEDADQWEDVLNTPGISIADAIEAAIRIFGNSPEGIEAVVDAANASGVSAQEIADNTEFSLDDIIAAATATGAVFSNNNAGGDNGDSGTTGGTAVGEGTGTTTGGAGKTNEGVDGATDSGDSGTGVGGSGEGDGSGSGGGGGGGFGIPTGLAGVSITDPIYAEIDYIYDMLDMLPQNLRDKYGDEELINMMLGSKSRR